MDPDPFDPSPTFIKDVRSWDNSTVQVLDAGDKGYPVSPGQLKTGWYKFSAVIDVNTTERSNTAVAGNFYARKDVLVEVRQGTTNEVHLLVNSLFTERVFKETELIRELSFKSRMLSRFHKMDVFIKAAVVLPASYRADTLKKYPVVFIIPGWGGTQFDVLQKFAAERFGIGSGKEKIYVYLNPETQTPYGLHAFVDSRVNGPWGKALVTELKPWLAAKFRINTDPSQHFVVGQSSGGYAALWLQLNYPGDFGACWAVSPDPVDFSNFTGINLYEKNANMYYDSAGKERPFFIWQGKPVSTLKRFLEFERFLGDGGQQQSFEAEFGIMDIDGRPRELYDRKTGVVNPAVVDQWKRYDLGLYIQQHWKRIRKKLTGKIHVFAGADDNFDLQYAVEAFGKKARSVHAGVVAELVPGANHWTIWKKEFSARMQSMLDSKIKNDN